MIACILGALGIAWPLETAQRKLLNKYRTDIMLLRGSLQAARASRDLAVADRDRALEAARIAGEVNAELRERLEIAQRKVRGGES